MRARMIRAALRGCVSGGLLLVLGAPALSAQLRDLGFTAYTGAAIPMGRFADYAKGGPAFGLQIGYPISEPVELFLNADVDLLNGNSSYGMPDLNLFRYQAGIASELVGRRSDRWGLEGQLGLGATTFRSRTFYLNNSPDGHRFRQTYLSGTAGLKFVFGSGPLNGYLGSRLAWAPMKEEDTQVLRDKSGGAFSPLSNSLHVPVTFGLRIRTS